MKFSTQIYTEALLNALKEASEEEKEKVLLSFVRVLDKNGDGRYRDRIVESVHKKIVQQNGGKWVSVEFARELTESHKKTIKEAFAENDHVSFSINPTLVAGTRITIDGEKELDASLNKKLKMALGA
jgi:F0F1-type ATP synthase delta subunit